VQGALAVATANNSLPVVKLLLQRKARVEEMKGFRKISLASFAVQTKNNELLKLLLEARADPNSSHEDMVNQRLLAARFQCLCSFIILSFGP
jgi:hypothetical protein